MYDELKVRDVRRILRHLTDDISRQIERYGMRHNIGPEAVFETAVDDVDAYESGVGLATAAGSDADPHDT